MTICWCHFVDMVMIMDFRKIKEGEFWRLSETGQLIDYTLCESMADIDKFQLIARLKNENVIYSVRHGRNDSLRTWRLDVMAKALKQRGITEFTVKMVDGE